MPWISVDFRGFGGDRDGRVQEVELGDGLCTGFVADEGDGDDAVHALVQAGRFEVEDHQGAVELQGGG